MPKQNRVAVQPQQRVPASAAQKPAQPNAQYIPPPPHIAYSDSGLGGNDPPSAMSYTRQGTSTWPVMGGIVKELEHVSSDLWGLISLCNKLYPILDSLNPTLIASRGYTDVRMPPAGRDKKIKQPVSAKQQAAQTTASAAKLRNLDLKKIIPNEHAREEFWKLGLFPHLQECIAYTCELLPRVLHFMDKNLPNDEQVYETDLTRKALENGHSMAVSGLREMAVEHPYVEIANYPAANRLRSDPHFVQNVQPPILHSSTRVRDQQMSAPSTTKDGRDVQLNHVRNLCAKYDMMARICERYQMQATIEFHADTGFHEQLRSSVAALLKLMAECKTVQQTVFDLEMKRSVHFESVRMAYSYCLMTESLVRCMLTVVYLAHAVKGDPGSPYLQQLLQGTHLWDLVNSMINLNEHARLAFIRRNDGRFFSSADSRDAITKWLRSMSQQLGRASGPLTEVWNHLSPANLYWIWTGGQLLMNATVNFVSLVADAWASRTNAQANAQEVQAEIARAERELNATIAQAEARLQFDRDAAADLEKAREAEHQLEQQRIEIVRIQAETARLEAEWKVLEQRRKEEEHRVWKASMGITLDQGVDSHLNNVKRIVASHEQDRAHQPQQQPAASVEHDPQTSGGPFFNSQGEFQQHINHVANVSGYLNMSTSTANITNSTSTINGH